MIQRPPLQSSLPRKSKKRRIAFAFALICLICALVPSLLMLAPNISLGPLNRSAAFINSIFDTGENLIRDRLVLIGRKAPVDKNLVFLAIDNASIKLDQFSDEEIGQSLSLTAMKQGWPWSREVYAYALEKLFTHNARVVAIDVLFLTSTRYDAVLEQALNQHNKQVVIGCNFVDKHQQVSGVNYQASSLDLPSPTIIPYSTPLDHRVGFVNFFPDQDDVIRRAIYRSILPDSQPILSLAAATLTQAGLKEKIPKDLNSHQIRFAGPAGSYQAISLALLFDTKNWEPLFQNGDFFKDKIVLIGPEGNWSQDMHLTPFGMMSGPELHLNSIAAALHNQFVEQTTLITNLLIILIAALFAFACNRWVQGISLRLLSSVASVIFFAILLLLFYNYFNLYLLSFIPLCVFGSSSFGCLVYELLVERLEKYRVRATLEKYVSKNVVSQLLDHEEEYEITLGGMRKPVTILFSDLRNFTTLTESADSHALVLQLNEYLTEMVDSVFTHQGTLDKFIGDAVMAVWGNAISHGVEQDAIYAVTTALMMQEKLKKLQRSWQEQNKPIFHMGIGIHHGEVIVGNMGSPQRMEFTVIGDAVNLASRIEGLTKRYPCDLLLGDEVARLIQSSFWMQSVACVQVKGKSKAVNLFTVIGSKKDPLPQQKQQFLELYEKGIEAFRQARFQEAIYFFEKCQKLEPKNLLMEIYLEQSRHLLAYPPDSSWQAIDVIDAK